MSQKPVNITLPPMPEEDEITQSEVEENVAEPVQAEDAPDYEALYRRALADAENARKRMEEEKRQVTRFAQEDLISELLPVVDNFYRATEHVPEDQKNSPWTAGILHIRKQLLDVLDAAGVVEVSATIGDRFNPTQHEAIGTAVREDMEEDHIVEIKNRGYLLRDRVLRPAMVIVSTAK